MLAHPFPDLNQEKSFGVKEFETQIRPLGVLMGNIILPYKIEDKNIAN